jgi:penicillin-binding protein 2
VKVEASCRTAHIYDKIYGKHHWVANTIISDAIGQGEILATPMQIANLCATIANRGYFITPHIVKHIYGLGILKKNVEKHYPTIDKQYYYDVVDGMRMAVLGGTCRLAQFPGVDVCGKTGTAQNPHGRDHSAFMGFAPMVKPKIAVCVYVENAGFGATFGVPIGGLMMEMYVNGKIAPQRQYLEDEMVNASTIAYSGIKKRK